MSINEPRTMLLLVPPELVLETISHLTSAERQLLRFTCRYLYTLISLPSLDDLYAITLSTYNHANQRLCLNCHRLWPRQLCEKTMVLAPCVECGNDLWTPNNVKDGLEELRLF